MVLEHRPQTVEGIWNWAEPRELLRNTPEKVFSVENGLQRTILVRTQKQNRKAAEKKPQPH